MLELGIGYEKFEHPEYKYRLLKGRCRSTSIIPKEDIDTEFIKLDRMGNLYIKKGYAWDGATGAIDTPSIIHASLPHDAFCQLANMGLLPKSSRKKADKLFRKMCRTDGMWWPRVWWTYLGVVEYRRLKHKFFN